MRGGGGRKFTTFLSSSTNEKLHEAPQQSSFVTPWHTHQFSYSMQTQIWLRIENNGIIWRREYKTEYYDFLFKWNTPRLFLNESHREGNIKWIIKTKEGWFSFEQTPEHERPGQVNEWGSFCPMACFPSIAPHNGGLLTFCYRASLGVTKTVGSWYYYHSYFYFNYYFYYILLLLLLLPFSRCDKRQSPLSGAAHSSWSVMEPCPSGGSGQILRTSKWRGQDSGGWPPYIYNLAAS